jgi:hypothetical protein
MAFTVRLITSPSWTLTSTGLTSTDIAGLGINNNDHILAATRSIMGESGGMFRSTDNGDSWTGQNNGFTAFDANAITFNSVSEVFATDAGGVFRSTNDGASWTALVAASFLSAEMFGAGHRFGKLCLLPERLVAEYFAASDPVSRCEWFRAPGSAQRQRRDPNTRPPVG